MKRYRVTVDGRTYDVEIDDPRARPVTARVLGEVFRVDIETEGIRPRGVAAVEPVAQPSRPAPRDEMPAAPAPPAGAGQQQLTAPIPGTISKISVNVGQAVARGDELLTIEAMKMFNVIRSPWAGTIVSIQIKEGQNVQQAQLLLTMTVN